MNLAPANEIPAARAIFSHSIGGFEMLAADHHADALAYRVRLRELGELLDFDRAVARGCVGERGNSGGGHFAAHDARARFRFRGSHQRKMIRQPCFHPDHEPGELAGGVANHVGAVRRREVGSLEAEHRNRARVEPGRVQRLMAQAQRILRHRRVELGARRPAIVEHHRFVASERAHPVAGRSLARGEPQDQPADRRRCGIAETEIPVAAAAASRKWMCESMKPGATVRPASLTR